MSFPETPPESDNYADSLYWFRRYWQHPVQRIEEVAAKFRDLVVADLNLQPPAPQIVWFKPEQHQSASAEWLAISEKFPQADWDIRNNPWLLPCEVFRFHKEESGKEWHYGYTHRNSRMVGIRCDLDERKTLETIAHECFHVYQDDREPGWRMEHVREAEDEAEAYTYRARTKYPEFFRQ